MINNTLQTFWANICSRLSSAFDFKLFEAFEKYTIAIKGFSRLRLRDLN